VAGRDSGVVRIGGLWLHVAGLLFLGIVALPASVTAAPGDGGGEAVATALHRGLDQDRYWKILLHYRPGLRGSRSLIDDPAFFLAPTGKTDPAAELAATIATFLRPPSAHDDDPRCHFPARFAWLVDEGILDPARLPPVACDDLDRTLARVDPQAATLVFPVAHMNDPASMFGHTLLRIDSSFASPLLSHAVNYAAKVEPTDNGIAYAFKGIFGGYAGHYSILPYYEMVKTYSHMDQRDIWEYRLDLTAAEVRRLFLHVWELQDTWSDYFFFDENCSYNLLFLLEAARPAVHLTDRFPAWVIPLDTVEEVARAGLIGAPVYRPSPATNIRYTASLLDEAGRAAARRLIDGELSPDDVAAGASPVVERARVLDLATEYVQLRYAGGGLDQESYRHRFLGYLTARSKLGTEGAVDPPPPAPPPPERGHPSQRLTVAAGGSRGDAFVETTYRPAYHDLLDPGAGYVEGSMIEFSTITLRHAPARDASLLHRWDLIHIVSLAPRDDFFRPVSWKVRTGFASRLFGEREDGLVYSLNPGGGFTWHHPRLGLCYLLGETALDISGRFDHGYAISVGGSAGLITQLTSAWKAHLELRGLAAMLGDATHQSSLTLGQSFRLSRHHAMGVDLERDLTEAASRTEVRVSWNVYF
jgi:hypothetical protein